MVGHRLFISLYLPKEEFERLSSRSSFFSSVVSSKLVTVSTFSEMFESSCFFRCPVRDRPFNLKGGVMVFCFVQNFFFGQNKSQNIYFFPEFNIRLCDKNSESDYFFFLHQNQNILFSNIGNQNIFQKRTITPSFKLNGRSLSISVTTYQF